MKRSFIESDIVEVNADALIYSTNYQLMLSGGVGACLYQKFGNQFQNDLYRKIDSLGRKCANIGEVFFSEMHEGPWKVIVHTVATDPFYHTDPAIVRTILRQTFAHLANCPAVKSVVMSPLGAGYGDLPIDTFLKIVTDESRAYEDSTIEHLMICCDSILTIRELAATAKQMLEEKDSTKIWHEE
jgi:O-acetyl-ADP-ribose deacetylase (regulator of RNase III)